MTQLLYIALGALAGMALVWMVAGRAVVCRSGPSRPVCGRPRYSNAPPAAVALARRRLTPNGSSDDATDLSRTSKRDLFVAIQASITISWSTRYFSV